MRATNVLETEGNRDRMRAEVMRENGESIASIATELGRAKSTVGQWLRGVGEANMRRACKLCGEDFLTGRRDREFCSRAHKCKHHELNREDPA